ncbi:unnamed protein product [Cyprideis torosa]|uniref:Uncharacterized protein n=1 Tax=Cyprideis torosa TaxID=163714 RepID=A0A7R8WTB8_9CRUS|nr:unnamed protein product [Cyprideis torosa]CAG0905991.1 unnamed protein product [Cyprideis torosa]
MVWGTGYALTKELIKHLLNHPKRSSHLQIKFDHCVKDILTESGRVVGVRGVLEKDHSKEFVAKAGTTVIASGGMGGSIEKVKEHWYKPWGEAPEKILNGSTVYADGAMHDAVKKINGEVLNQKIAYKEFAISGAESNAAIRDKKFFQFIKNTLFGNKELVNDMVENCPDFVTANSIEELVEKMNALQERIAYLAEMASVQLKGYDHMVLIDAKAPVSFFGYPGKKSYLVPENCKVHNLVEPHQDALKSLRALEASVGASDTPAKLQAAERPKLPSGKLNSEKVMQAIGALLPENAIISDEAQTSGVKLPAYTAGAPKHDLLTLTGGAIGQGLPVAVGAAIAGKNRPVLALVGDGSSMYTIQALWTIVAEQLDVTTIIFNNASYAILNIELERVGAEKAGPKAKAQLDISNPPIDFVSLANGMGMPALRTDNAEDFVDALKKSFSKPGPHLIDAVVPSEYKGLKLKALPYLLNTLDKIPNPIAKAIKKKFAP